MAKEQVEKIEISITVTLKGHGDRVLTSVTTTDNPLVGAFGAEINAIDVANKIHDNTRKLGDRVTEQVIGGLKEIDY